MGTREVEREEGMGTREVEWMRAREVEREEGWGPGRWRGGEGERDSLGMDKTFSRDSHLSSTAVSYLSTRASLFFWPYRMWYSRLVRAAASRGGWVVYWGGGRRGGRKGEKGEGEEVEGKEEKGRRRRDKENGRRRGGR